MQSPQAQKGSFPDESVSSQDSGSTPSARRRGFARWLQLALGLVLLGAFISLVFASFSSASHRQPGEALFRPLSLSWWVRPLEINPWAALDRLPSAPIRALHFIDEERGFIGSDQGFLARTTDAGRSWQPAGGTWPGAIRDIDFFDANNGIAVGEDELYLQTSDGGQTWQQREIDSLQLEQKASALPIAVPESPAANQSRDFTEIYRADSRVAWILGTSNSLYVTTDAARSWERLSTTVARYNPETAYVSMAFHPDGRHFLLTDDGYIVQSEADGYSWTEPPVRIEGPTDETGRISPIDEILGLGDSAIGLGPNGNLFRLYDGGKYQLEQTLPRVSRIADADSFSRSNAPPILAAVSADGSVLVSEDQGQTWAERSPREPNPLSRVQTLSSKRWIVGGADGVLWALDPGSRQWTPRSANAWPGLPPQSAQDATRVLLPPPWTWLAVMLMVPGAISVYRKRNEVEVTIRKAVADLFVSDKPLEEGDPDWLNFGFYAKGISSYIQNAATQPPLTIAITGKWGSGKSSMMNLLKSDLAKSGYRPIWFNAWHHQQEDHLLASLLQTVKGEVSPQDDFWQSILYRYRLLQTRVARHPYRSALLALLFLFSIGLAVGPTPEVVAKAIAASEGDASLFTELFGATLNVLVAKGGIALAPILAFLRALRSFGVTPSDIVSGKFGSASSRKLEDRTSFRQRFAHEFREVTNALKPKAIVLLIDDLDRCQPQSVLQVLESINFLSTAGDCYIVLGMDIDRVRDAVAACYNDIDEGYLDAQEFAPVAPDVGELTSFQKQRRFAEHYLEKLVQVRVPVPTLTPEAARQLATQSSLSTDGNGKSPQDRDPWPARLWQRRRSLLSRAAIAALGIGALIGGYRIDSLLPTDEAPPLARAEAEADTSSPEADSVAKVPESPEQETAEAAAETPDFVQASIEEASTVSAETSPETGSNQFGFHSYASANLQFLGAATLLGLGLWMGVQNKARQQSREVIQDSQAFRAALAKWSELLYRAGKTPRYVKRFINRVRFFAMLQRQMQEAPQGDTEHALIGFGAVEGAFPHLLGIKDRSQLQSQVNQLFANPLDQLDANDIVRVVEAYQSGKISQQFVDAARAIDIHS